VDIAEAKAAIADSGFRQRQQWPWRIPAIGSGLLLAGLIVGAASMHWMTPSVAVTGKSVAPASITPPAAVTSPTPASPPLRPESFLDERIRKTRTRFTASPAETFTILLLVAPRQHADDFEQTLTQLARKLPIDELYVYPTTTREGVAHYGLTMGLYPSRQAASAALAALPAELRRAHPMLRTIGGIRDEQDEH
jgi:septal ring-binding cell division protein DamX